MDYVRESAAVGTRVGANLCTQSAAQEHDVDNTHLDGAWHTSATFYDHERTAAETGADTHSQSTSCMQQCCSQIVLTWYKPDKTYADLN